jgi:hypothetical protein
LGTISAFGKDTGKDVRFDTMKAFSGARDTAPLILNLCAEWEWFAANRESSNCTKITRVSRKWLTNDDAMLI